MSEVPDAAFSTHAVGEGLAIRPAGTLVVAPCDGHLANIFSTNHAFAIVTQAGAEIIVHMGVDTVKLGGQGFKRLAQPGTHVKAGEPVLEIDLAYLAAHAVSMISPVVVSNADEFEVIDWPQIFGVKPTSFKDAVTETFSHPKYSKIVLEF